MAVSNRLSYALNRNQIDATYRDQILSVTTRFLEAQSGGSGKAECLIYLPYLSCRACGGDTKKITGVTTSWFLFQTAAYLLDKVEDAELLHASRTDIGVTANLSTGMIFIAEWILNHLELDSVDPGSAWDIQRAFHESVLSVCSGQHLDLSVTMPSLEDCWGIARQKSGAAFGLACYSGARVAINDTDLLKRLKQFGKHFGVIIQICDDLEDVVSCMGSGDSFFDKAPIFKAIARHIKLSFFENMDSDQPGICQNDDVLAKSSAIYLRLEALKLAACAKRELDIPGFEEEGKSGLLQLLRNRPIIQGFIN